MLFNNTHLIKDQTSDKEKCVGGRTTPEPKKLFTILWCGSVFDSAAIVAAPKGKSPLFFDISISITTTKNYLKHQRLNNMDVLQNAHPITIRAYGRRFYPKQLTSVNTHIDTPPAESTTQGDSQLVRSS